MNWSGNFREGLAREIRENKNPRENNSLYSSSRHPWAASFDIYAKW